MSDQPSLELLNGFTLTAMKVWGTRERPPVIFLPGQMTDPQTQGSSAFYESVEGLETILQGVERIVAKTVSLNWFIAVQEVADGRFLGVAFKDYQEAIILAHYVRRKITTMALSQGGGRMLDPAAWHWLKNETYTDSLRTRAGILEVSNDLLSVAVAFLAVRHGEARDPVDTVIPLKPRKQAVGLPRLPDAMAYSVVDLTKLTPPSSSGGSTPGHGERGSPREHWKRGHWRTRRKSGKQYWVNAFKSGDPSKGTVLHDYIIKEPS